MKFADVNVGDKIINSEHSLEIYTVTNKSHDLISVTNINNYKDCFHLTKTSIRKYELFKNFQKDIMINAKNWQELKRQLRPLQGKAVFELERTNSMNDGKFIRVLHQVKPHELIFFDGKEKCYLTILKDMEQDINFFDNGFSYKNCTYLLKQVLED